MASRFRLHDRLRGASDASREPCSLFGKWSVLSLRTRDGRGAWRQPPLVWPGRAAVVIDLAEEQLGSSPGVLHALASKLRVIFRAHEKNVPLTSSSNADFSDLKSSRLCHHYLGR
eukprot:jgi/Tetstr1/427432/TSEL_017595.t1